MSEASQTNPSSQTAHMPSNSHRRLVRRASLSGLLSYAMIGTTLFAILSGVLVNGSQYIPAFLLTALVLTALACGWYRDAGRLVEGKKPWASRTTWFLLGIVVVAGGMADLLLKDSEQVFYSLVIFAPVAILMWIRMLEMVDNEAHARQQLLDHYKQEIVLLFAVAIGVWIFQQDPGWQKKMVPYLVLYLLVRLMALSFYSQLLKGVSGRQSRWENWQNNLPGLVIAVAFFIGWILNSIGVPVLSWLQHLIIWILSPLFYGVGMLVEKFMNWFLTEDRIKRRADAMNKEGKDVEDQQQDQLPLTDNHLITESVLVVFAVSVFLLLLRLYLKKKNRTRRGRFGSEFVEVREFLQSDRGGKRKAVFAGGGPLTPMRKAYRKFLLAMKRQGHPRRPSQTAGEFIGALAATRPDMKESLGELTNYYLQERYGGRPVEAELPRAERLADDLSGGKDTKR
jgi:hypothetical protein